MSGRMNRVKEAIMRTVEESKRAYAKGPNHYLAGFYNAMALCDHHLQGRSGKPPQIEVGSLRVNPEPSRADEQEYEHLLDKVLTAARGVKMNWKLGAPEGTDALDDALKELDNFIDGKMDEAGQGESEVTSDAGALGQEGSSPSPASP